MSDLLLHCKLRPRLHLELRSSLLQASCHLPVSLAALGSSLIICFSLFTAPWQSEASLHYSTPWQIDGETMETETELNLGAPESLQMVIAAMKLKDFLLGRKVMTNLNSILKSRDISLPTKVCIVKAMIFPVVIFGCESWTIKKAEH